MRFLPITIVLFFGSRFASAQGHQAVLHLADQANVEEMRCSLSPANELLIDRYKEGKRVERIAVSAEHVDPLSFAIEPISRSLRFACLPDRPHCIHRDLFSRSASMRTSRVETFWPDSPDTAHTLMEWIRESMRMNQDRDSAPLVETRP